MQTVLHNHPTTSCMIQCRVGLGGNSCHHFPWLAVCGGIRSPDWPRTSCADDDDNSSGCFKSIAVIRCSLHSLHIFRQLTKAERYQLDDSVSEMAEFKKVFSPLMSAKGSGQWPSLRSTGPRCCRWWSGWAWGLRLTPQSTAQGAPNETRLFGNL